MSKNKTKNKNKKPRCSHKDCCKKLKLTDLPCGKCKKRYCSKHRSVAEHICCEEKDISDNVIETAQFKKIDKI